MPAAALVHWPASCAGFVEGCDACGVADDGEGPVEALADGDEEEVLGEDVHPPRPLGYACVTLLRCRPLQQQPSTFLLTEDMKGFDGANTCK